MYVPSPPPMVGYGKGPHASFGASSEAISRGIRQSQNEPRRTEPIWKDQSLGGEDIGSQLQADMPWRTWHVPQNTELSKYIQLGGTSEISVRSFNAMERDVPLFGAELSQDPFYEVQNEEFRVKTLTAMHNASGWELSRLYSYLSVRPP